MPRSDGRGLLSLRQQPAEFRAERLLCFLERRERRAERLLARVGPRGVIDEV